MGQTYILNSATICLLLTHVLTIVNYSSIHVLYLGFVAVSDLIILMSNFDNSNYLRLIKYPLPILVSLGIDLMIDQYYELKLWPFILVGMLLHQMGDMISLKVNHLNPVVELIRIYAYTFITLTRIIIIIFMNDE